MQQGLVSSNTLADTRPIKIKFVARTMAVDCSFMSHGSPLMKVSTPELKCLSSAPCFMSRRRERQKQSTASKAAGDI